MENITSRVLTLLGQWAVLGSLLAILGLIWGHLGMLPHPFIIHLSSNPHPLLIQGKLADMYVEEYK
jgi:hypothetical protein